MSETVFVRPAPGLKIRMPERGFAILPEEGRHVPLDGYWRARLRDGDVVMANDTAAAPAKKPKA